MIENFPFFIGLIVVIALLIALSNKIKVAYPVVLVIAGLLISFVPGVPTLKIDPELIFVIFLPPLLYEAAWTNSWKELWHWRRIISSFAFILVFLTAISVAIFTNYFIPGFSLALGFLLGGIVSPPDAVSASAILKFVKVPKRVSTILEGESLLNDASSLIIFRFALIAVATGQFIWYEAAMSFVWMLIGGVGCGLAIGFIFLKVHKKITSDENITTILTLMTPFIMYISAEEMHASGVLAVVSGGLFLSYHQYSFLGSSSRLKGENVWESYIFLLNGLVFMLIGLDLPEIMAGVRSDGLNFYQATSYGIAVSVLLIFGRMLAAYGAVIITRIMSRFITVADNSPGNKGPIIMGWTGMRGVVSLAAALSIPIAIDGVPFPHRHLILYITFVVILITLVVQGLTLPFLIRNIKLPTYVDHFSEEETELRIHRQLASVSVNFLSENYQEEISKSHLLQKLIKRWNTELESEEITKMPERIKDIYRTLLESQRKSLIELNRNNQQIDEDVIKKYLHHIDLEEEKLQMD